MEGNMEDLILWVLNNALLIIGILIVLYGLKMVYRGDNWGIWILSVGVVLIVMFFTVDDWGHLLTAFRSAWESAIR
jgi:hypothetical protein